MQLQKIHSNREIFTLDLSIAGTFAKCNVFKSRKKNPTIIFMSTINFLFMTGTLTRGKFRKLYNYSYFALKIENMKLFLKKLT